VLQVADQAASPAAHDRVRLLGLTPEAITVGPADRAAMFSVTEAMDALGTAYRAGRWQVPYRARWAVTAPSDENLTLRGHQGRVQAVFAVQAGDRTLLATSSYDRTVRLWDPADGRCVLTVPVHHDVSAVAPVGDLLAIGLPVGVIAIKFEADLLA
jgi:hypothetical protein